MKKFLLTCSLLLATCSFVHGAAITATNIGAFHKLPAWMPTSVAASYMYGSTTNCDRRITVDYLASMVATSEGWCERFEIPFSYGTYNDGTPWYELEIPEAGSNRVVSSRRVLQYPPTPKTIVTAWDGQKPGNTGFLGWGSSAVDTNAPPISAWVDFDDLPFKPQEWKSCGSLLDRHVADGIYLQKCRPDVVRAQAVKVAEDIYNDTYPTNFTEEIDKRIAAQSNVVAQCEEKVKNTYTVVTNLVYVNDRYNETEELYISATNAPRNRVETTLGVHNVAKILEWTDINDYIPSYCSITYTGTDKSWNKVKCLTRMMTSTSRLYFLDVNGNKISSSEGYAIRSVFLNYVNGVIEPTEDEQADIDKYSAEFKSAEEAYELAVGGRPYNEVYADAEAAYADAVSDLEDAKNLLASLIDDRGKDAAVLPFDMTIPERLASVFVDLGDYSVVMNDTRRYVVGPHACANQLLALMDRTWHAWPFRKNLERKCEGTNMYHSVVKGIVGRARDPEITFSGGAISVEYDDIYWEDMELTETSTGNVIKAGGCLYSIDAKGSENPSAAARMGSSFSFDYDEIRDALKEGGAQDVMISYSGSGFDENGTPCTFYHFDGVKTNFDLTATSKGPLECDLNFYTTFTSSRTVRRTWPVMTGNALWEYLMPASKYLSAYVVHGNLYMIGGMEYSESGEETLSPATNRLYDVTSYTYSGSVASFTNALGSALRNLDRDTENRFSKETGKSPAQYLASYSSVDASTIRGFAEKIETGRSVRINIEGAGGGVGHAYWTGSELLSVSNIYTNVVYQLVPMPCRTNGYQTVVDGITCTMIADTNGVPIEAYLDDRTTNFCHVAADILEDYDIGSKTHPYAADYFASGSDATFGWGFTTNGLYGYCSMALTVGDEPHSAAEACNWSGSVMVTNAYSYVTNTVPYDSGIRGTQLGSGAIGSITYKEDGTPDKLRVDFPEDHVCGLEGTFEWVEEGEYWSAAFGLDEVEESEYDGFCEIWDDGVDLYGHFGYATTTTNNNIENMVFYSNAVQRIETPVAVRGIPVTVTMWTNGVISVTNAVPYSQHVNLGVWTVNWEATDLDKYYPPSPFHIDSTMDGLIWMDWRFPAMHRKGN